jgi:lysophospholipase L1-like esterase
MSSDPMARIARVLDGSERGPRTLRARSYVALGDSFTAGTGCSAGEAWPDRLASHLRDANSELIYRNLGSEGARSGDVVDQVSDALQIEPDLVTVVCGVNDALFSVRPDELAYARNLGAIFGRLRNALPGLCLVTATAPERWEFLGLGPRTAERLEAGIVRLNRATRSVAEAHGVACLDVATHPGLSDAANFNNDGLHPSPAGHACAAAEFARMLAPRASAAAPQGASR